MPADVGARGRGHPENGRQPVTVEIWTNKPFKENEGALCSPPNPAPFQGLQEGWGTPFCCLDQQHKSISATRLKTEIEIALLPQEYLAYVLREKKNPKQTTKSCWKCQCIFKDAMPKSIWRGTQLKCPDRCPFSIHFDNLLFTYINKAFFYLLKSPIIFMYSLMIVLHTHKNTSVNMSVARPSLLHLSFETHPKQKVWSWNGWHDTALPPTCILVPLCAPYSLSSMPIGQHICHLSLIQQLTEGHSAWGASTLTNDILLMSCR